MTEPPGGDIGAWLRSQREQSGLTLRHIADTTKLSVRTFELLERNRVDELPGGIYRRAIVRAYAAEIGLDPEATLGAFLARHPQESDVPEMPPRKLEALMAHPRRRLRTLAIFVAALVPIVAGRAYLPLRWERRENR